MKAVIMAGGKGTRLRPLTCHTPKPMVPILNRPCMEYTIHLLRSYGIKDIAVTVQYLPDVIRSYFGDGSDFGVNLVYYEESTPLGTAGSVKNAEEFLDETFIVISGDGLTDFNLKEAIEFHNKRQAMATLVLTRVSTPLEYGVVMTDSFGRVNRFLEKPSWSEVFSDTVNTGIYILEPEVFRYYERDKVYDFSNDLFPLLLTDEQPMFGYVAEGYWSDIGNIQQYRQTHFDLLNGQVNISLPAEQIKPGLWVEPGVKLPRLLNYTAPVFIGSGTELEENCELGKYTVIGRNNRISSFSLLERSILWDGNRIEKQAELQGATLCGDVRIGTGATLFDESVIGENVNIGQHSLIKSRVKIWPGKLIQQNTTVHTSLVWGDQMSRVLFSSLGIMGIANVDITPDFVTKLASAYGSLLPPGSKISISSCAHPFCKILKQSFSAGLGSASIDTVDFDTAISNVVRIGISHLELNGGIHIRMMNPRQDARVVIEFLDKTGFPISKGMERKIENAYHQEDYVRSSLDKLGEEESHHQLESWYLERLLKQVSTTAIRNKKLKIVLQYNHQNYGDLLLRIMDTLRCTTISYLSDESIPNQELAQMVQNNQADLGVFLNANGQNMMLVTSKGFVIQGDLLMVLKALVIFQSEQDVLLGIPVSAPHVIESIAHGFGGGVIRTKENIRSIMEVGKPREFHPLFDDLYSLVKIMEYMATQETDLSDILGLIPKFHLIRETVPCPWNEKGKVMRMMMNSISDRYTELLDGIKIYDEDGWVLILPDLDSPSFKIIAQSKSSNAATEMVDSYVSKIMQSIAT